MAEPTPKSGLVACERCGWTAACNKGDLVITVTTTEDECVSHEIKEV